MIEVAGNQAKPHMVFAVARRRNLGSFITRMTDPGARWGHTAFFDQERGVMIEALLFKGVVETPVDEWLTHYPSFKFFAVSVPHPLLGTLWQRMQVGKGYDYRGAFGVPLRANWDNPGAWYCHELLEAVLKEAGARRWYCDHCPKTPTESFLVK